MAEVDQLLTIGIQSFKNAQSKITTDFECISHENRSKARIPPEKGFYLSVGDIIMDVIKFFHDSSLQ